MTNRRKTEVPAERTTVLNLGNAPGEREAWDRPIIVVYLWALCELLLVTNALQVSSKLRVAALRLFGAKIGHDVIFRPRTKVKFPWKLHVGDRSWIGEGAHLHNQDVVRIGSDCVVSQDAFITTGSHAYRTNMALITRPVVIEDGAWVTARSVILGGVVLGRSSILAPNSVLGPNIEAQPAVIYRGNPAVIISGRFSETEGSI